jgi:hypothetical protein
MNYNRNIDLIPPEAMVDGSRNIDLSKGGRGKRGGTSHVNGAAIDSSSKQSGIHHFLQKDGTSKILVATHSPKIFQDYTNDITNTTDWTTANRNVVILMYEDDAFFFNGSDDVQTWDGSAGTTTNITTPAADWSGTNNPAWGITHGRGVFEKIWCGGVANQLQRLYFSKTGDGKDFTDATAGNIDIDTGNDGYGIVGAGKFGQRLFAFGKRQSFIIDDTDSSVANWGYYKAWEGGAGTFKLIIPTPYDLVIMAEDGDIYSAVTAEQYGDYKLASIARPAYINEWIKDNIKLSEINTFHGVYDPALRCIYFFLMRSSNSYIDLALTYYVDRGPMEGWMVNDNQSYQSGFRAGSSCSVRVSTGDYKVYTGGWDSGYVWKLNHTAYSDNANAYYSGYKTSKNPFDNARELKKFDQGHVVAEEKGNQSLYINHWIDNESMGTETVSLAGNNSVYGTGVYGTATYSGGTMIEDNYIIGNIGKRYQLELYNSTAGESFFVSQHLIDYQPLRSRTE